MFFSLTVRSNGTHCNLKYSGVIGLPTDQVTVDGYDVTWGTNALGEKCSIVGRRSFVLSGLCEPGPFYFTRLLLPALSKASTPENKSRVVNTSSSGSVAGLSYFGSGLDFSTFKDSPQRHKYDTGNLYSQSKLVRAVITGVELTDRSKTFKPTRGMWCSPRNLHGAMATRS
jgi:retinol dehydrogenase-12